MWDQLKRLVRRWQPHVTPPDGNLPEPSADVLRFLAAAFKSHGASATLSRRWVVVDEGILFARGWYGDVQHHPQGLVVQLNYVLVTARGQWIFESFAGIATNLANALEDANKCFLDCSFHVLFSRLLSRPCSEVDVENWIVDGIRRDVAIGRLYCRGRGHEPWEWWPPLYLSIQTVIQATAIPRGMHWLRFYYGGLPQSDSVVEVLLDNQPLLDVQDQVRKLPWPEIDTFYSVRFFLIMQDAIPTAIESDSASGG